MSVQIISERAVKESGLGNFHFHHLRHTFATRLRAANVHEYDIADLLGHSTTPGETRNTKVTRGYAHGVPQRLRDAVNGLGEGKSSPDYLRDRRATGTRRAHTSRAAP